MGTQQYIHTYIYIYIYIYIYARPCLLFLPATRFSRITQYYSLVLLSLEVLKTYKAKLSLLVKRLPNMLSLGKPIKEEEAEFYWGKKGSVGGVNKDVQFYESFNYDGIQYFLYDSVYVWCGDDPEPSIGKLVKMWETPTHKKKMKIVWYFRPCEIQNFLGDAKPLKKELFLACGEGKGLFYIGSPEVIAGKCKVICTTADGRNPQVSNEVLWMADHIFFRTFDVGKCKLSERFPNEIAGHEVVHFFNRERVQNLSGSCFEEKNGKLILRLKGVSAVGTSIEDDKSDIRSRHTAELKMEEASLGKGPCFGAHNYVNRHTKAFSKVWPENSASPCKEVEGTADIRPIKKRKVHFNTVVEDLEPSKGRISDEKREKLTDTYAAGEQRERGSKICGQTFEVTRRPEKETNKWFKQQPWEVKMQRALETEALVLLENLDPSYTSSEVEDIVWTALNKKVDAKMIPLSTFSSPQYGKALVVFKSKDAAETAISELTKKCLVLTGGRPIVAHRGYPKYLNEETKFHGHLIMDNIRHLKQRKTAVSTSHCSQPNSIEHDMALGWRIIQEKSTLAWNALNEQHGKEIEQLRSKFKTNHSEQGLHHDQ